MAVRARCRDGEEFRSHTLRPSLNPFVAMRSREDDRRSRVVWYSAIDVRRCRSSGSADAVPSVTQSLNVNLDLIGSQWRPVRTEVMRSLILWSGATHARVFCTCCSLANFISDIPAYSELQWSRREPTMLQATSSGRDFRIGRRARRDVKIASLLPQRDWP